MPTRVSVEDSILLVDDNRTILDVLSSAIHLLLGISVRSFESPIAALKEFTEHPGEYLMVISDFDMPGMNGAELLQAIRACNPELPAVLFSGSTQEEIVGLPSRCRFLSKTGGFSQLMEAVRSAVVRA